MPAIVILLIALSLILSVALTPIVRSAALHWRLVDQPDNKRKVHLKPVARIGGVAVFAAYLGSICLVTIFAENRWEIHSMFAAVKALAPAAILVFVTGLVDDIIGLKPWHKLIAEILAAVLVISAGIGFRSIPSFAVHPIIGMLCTVGWLVLCANALNLIDGLDGLAAGIALVAAATVLLVSGLHGNAALAFAAAPLVGALLGFLIFNFNPASIFLGDSGSLLLGFLLGAYGILWNENSATLPKLAAPMIALAVPLADTTLAIIRRFLRAQPIFAPDRSHIHHRLLARGFTHRRAVLLLYVAAGIAGVFSLCLIVIGKRWEPVILAAFVGAVILAIRKLGYAEIDAASRLLSYHAFRREITAQLAVHGFEDRLSKAASAPECWSIIQEEARQFGFQAIHMRFAGQLFVNAEAAVPISSWTLRMPISQSDWIELYHEPGASNHASTAVSFVDVIRKTLAAKCAAFAASFSSKSARSGSSYAGFLSHARRV